MRLPRMVVVSRPWGWIIGPVIYLFPLFTFGKVPTLLNLLQMLVLSFPLCMLLFGVNDIYDRHTDRVNPRKGKAHGAVLRDSEVKKVWWYAGISGVLIVIVSVFTGIWQNVVLSLLLVGVSIFYSASPRLKELPPLDSLSNAFIIYLLFALGHTFVSPTLLLPFSGLYIDGYALLLGVVTIHMFSTIMDFSADRKAGVRTLATLVGRRRTAMVSLVLLVVTILMLQTRNQFILGFLMGSMVIYGFGYWKPDSITTRRLFLMQFFLFLGCSAGFLIGKA